VAGYGVHTSALTYDFELFSPQDRWLKSAYQFETFHKSFEITFKDKDEKNQQRIFSTEVHWLC
jgi:hypothetical protein